MNYASSNNYFEADLIAEAQGASISAYYTQGQGLLSQRRNNASYFYHYDGLGSTKALTDANQNIQSSTIYDAWGNILQSSGTITNPYLYVGELGYYGDGDAGMYLLTQRWYNPVVGRFVVRDENQRHRTLYPYLYTIDNPINYIDPLGWERCPNPNELPAESYRIIKSCAQNCFQKFHPSFQQTGDINNSYLKDFAQCVFKCTKGKLEDLGIDFVCCFWWWKVKGGEDATKDPWRVHPCSEDWLNRSGAEAANCQSCCDFKWCECIMHYAKGLKDVIKGFIKCTLAGRTACYLSCDACFSPYFPK
jgi:RHS repeat-associated protein